jgi:F-type H+-transporting ATPase subunit alpha
MEIRHDEITSIIRKELEKHKVQMRTDEVGTVIQVGDAIARVYGLDEVMVGELVKFPQDVMGIVLNLEEDNVGVAIFGPDNPDRNIKEGDIVKRTGEVARIPVGKALLGRVIDPLGKPLDDKGPIVTDRYRPLEANSPAILDRQPVKESLETGIKAIDAMIPIGRGQRELVIGDRQTGKTALAIDTIINQKGKNVKCVYVAIGQRVSNIVSVAKVLEKYGAMEYTTIVLASSLSTASLQFLAPYTGCAVGEEFMYTGEHALIIYDDLSKHAQAYRQLSLLLRRPPGREAYPGDIFYIHSRLLERAAKLKDDLGGGSLTAIPIIETQAGDITSYVPTNVISITDGQIYLESSLFYSGVRPAINVGLSVSRVGGKAQSKAMRQVSGKIRLDLAQYNELLMFTQFGAEVDKTTQAQLMRGERMVEALKQDVYCPLPMAKQVMFIYAGIKGYLDDVPTLDVRKFEEKFYAFIEAHFPEIEKEIQTKQALDDLTAGKLEQAVVKFKEKFVK